MRFPPYPRYKPSGVEWLGVMPEDWPVKPLRFLVRFHGGATPDKNRPDYWDGSIPWVSPKDMKRARLSDAEDHISEDALRHSPLSIISPNAILVVVRGMILAHSFPVALTEVPLTINQDMKALIARSVVDPRFLAWFLSGAAKAIVALADESAHGTRKLETATLGGLSIGVPALVEQRAIGDFLDAETARLDTLVAKKRALIERLKEKRTALISRTVTHGLPPDAARAAGLDPRPRLKRSSIHWLRNVPAHWEVKRLKHLVTEIEQGWSPECRSEAATADEWGVIKAGCCNGGRFNAEENKALPADLNPPRALEIRPGDVLMSRASGSEDLVGSVARVPEDTRRQLLLSDKTYRLHCDARKVDPALLTWLLQSSLGRLQIQAVISGASGLAKNIAQSDVKEFCLPLPPLPEQRTIANYLDRETARIDQIISKVEVAIERLQEYRSVLITAAVTGKIDVRRHAAQGLPTPAGSG